MSVHCCFGLPYGLGLPHNFLLISVGHASHHIPTDSEVKAGFFQNVDTFRAYARQVILASVTPIQAHTHVSGIEHFKTSMSMRLTQHIYQILITIQTYVCG